MTHLQSNYYIVEFMWKERAEDNKFKPVLDEIAWQYDV